MSGIDLVFMGGGPDSSQKEMYKDLTTSKASFLRDYIISGGVSLFVCGSYQLLGHYYKSADGSTLQGLGIFDLSTEHPGNSAARCVGNVVCTMSSTTSASSRCLWSAFTPTNALKRPCATPVILVTW